MNKQRRSSGQSLVEFAIIFPIAIFLILGFLDLGRAIFYYSSLTNGVREATRYAIVNRDEIIAAENNPTNNSLQDKVLEFAFGMTGSSNPLTKADIIVTVNRNDINLFTTISIEAIYSFRPITPFIQLLFADGEGIGLTAQSTMHVSPGSR